MSGKNKPIMIKLRHGSLFSGIGGFDLASEWMGWENVFHCEWNEFGKSILKYYWPNAISYDDITKTDFTIHRGGIDIITGGFPCQPYSMAGKRLGKADERHLWPEMLRTIREIQPRWVVGENVFGLINWNGGLVCDEVQTDLENEGYQIQPFVLPACSINAPHRRDRVWFIAYRDDNGFNGTKNVQSVDKGNYRNTSGEEKTIQFDGCTGPCATFIAYTHRTRCDERHGENEINASKGGFFTFGDPCSGDVNGDVANTHGEQGERMQFKQHKHCESEQIEFRGNNRRFGSEWDDTNTGNEGLEGGEFNESFNQEGQKRREQPSGSITEFCEISNWNQFPTQSPVCDGNDGFQTGLDVETISKSKWRNESIKAGGNAVVPPLVYQIFKAIEKYEYLMLHRRN